MSITICSGFWNPLHRGHLEYLNAAYEYCHGPGHGDVEFIAIVNNDEQVKLKGSIPFLNEDERYEIVNSLWMVNKTIIARDVDKSVANTLRFLVTRYNPYDKNVYFFNAGDRTNPNKKEDEICKKHNIKQVFLDLPKINSSSEILDGVGQAWAIKNPHDAYDVWVNYSGNNDGSRGFRKGL